MSNSVKCDFSSCSKDNDSQSLSFTNGLAPRNIKSIDSEDIPIARNGSKYNSTINKIENKDRKCITFNSHSLKTEHKWNSEEVRKRINFKIIENTDCDLSKFFQTPQIKNKNENRIVDCDTERNFYNDFITGNIKIVKDDNNSKDENDNEKNNFLETDRDSVENNPFSSIKSLMHIDEKFMLKHIQFQKIGEGTYGVVTRCYDFTDDEIVAIKKLKICREEKVQILYTEGINWSCYREGNFISTINSRYCVSAKSVSVIKNYVYIMFKNYSCNLHELEKVAFSKFGRMPLNLIKKIMRDLLRAVRYIHNVSGSIHRDIKLENVLIDINGYNNEVKTMFKAWYTNYNQITQLPTEIINESIRYLTKKLLQITEVAQINFLQKWFDNEPMTLSNEYKCEIDKNTEPIKNIYEYEKQIKDILISQGKILKLYDPSMTTNKKNPTTSRYKYYNSSINEIKNFFMTSTASPSSLISEKNCSIDSSSNINESNNKDQQKIIFIKEKNKQRKVYNLYELADYYSPLNDVLATGQRVKYCSYYSFPIALLTDFGLARKISTCGTMTPSPLPFYYKSPEDLLDSTFYNSTIDIWSLGILFYTLVTGVLLFRDNNSLPLFIHMINGLLDPENDKLNEIKLSKLKKLNKFPQIEFGRGLGLKNTMLLSLEQAQVKKRWPKYDYDFVYKILNDTEFLELLSGMLDINQETRWTADECLQCDFLKY